MAVRAVALIGLVMQITTSAQPPALLQIVREPLTPGSEAAFNAIEEERARMSATLGCPHPYLGAESLTGPKEVWWFNGYQSSTERQQVYDAYAKNAPLMAAFQKSAKPKAQLTLRPIEVFMSYRPDRSEGTPWLLASWPISRDSRLDEPLRRHSPESALEGEHRQNGRLVGKAAEGREEAEAAKPTSPSDTPLRSYCPSAQSDAEL